MNNTEKKNEVLEKSNVKKEQDLTSSYVKISDLTSDEIKGFQKGKGSFIPKVSKLSGSYTYQFVLHPNGLIINDVKDKSVNRENISLDEFNLIRMTNGKLDPYTLNHSFEGPIYYRLVKGEKQDKTKYYCVQYWLSPFGNCHIHYFSQTEIKMMKLLKQTMKADFTFIEKPSSIEEDETVNNQLTNDDDIL